MAEFTHLHLHTDYSLLDGACDVEKLVDRVADIGQKAVAITDHGNIYGAVHFFDAAKKKGIKPILGCELYICKEEDHRAPSQGEKYNHLLVLAENEEGYRNLVRITSEASLHGFYRKPRVSKKYLAEHSQGLVGFSGCLAGEVCESLMAGNYNAAKATAVQYQDIFGRGNFFLEIQDQGLELEKKIHADLFKLERELDIPLVATNDSHYLCEDDSHAHEVLLCVQTAGSINDPEALQVRLRPVLRQVGGADGEALLAYSRSGQPDNAVRRALFAQTEQGRQSVPRVFGARGAQHRQLLRAGMPAGPEEAAGNSGASTGDARCVAHAGA